MQRTGPNTIRLSGPKDLLPGGILAQANDNDGVAHHIQLVLGVDSSRIDVIQGNSGDLIIRPFTTFMRMLGKNRAAPKNDAYAGKPVEHGTHVQWGDDWNYRNTTTGNEKRNFLRDFNFYRWNLFEFNTVISMEMYLKTVANSDLFGSLALICLLVAALGLLRKIRRSRLYRMGVFACLLFHTDAARNWFVSPFSAGSVAAGTTETTRLATLIRII
jgi:hypothetical protein